MTQRKTTCFIAAPFGTDLALLETILQEKSVKVLKAPDSSIPTYDLAEQIKQAISRSDFVIAVLSSEAVRPNILFELGLAFGLTKQILIISPPTLASLPTDLMSMLNIRANPDNREALSFAIDQIVAAPVRKPSKTIKPSKAGKPIKKDARLLIKKFDSLGENIREREIIQILLAAIQLSGISIYAESNAREMRADIALWADDLAPAFKNPFLIEIKIDLTTRYQVERTIEQVKKYLDSNSTNGILLLYINGNPQEIARLVNVYPGILAMSVRQFLEQLERKSFSEIILYLRHQKLHRGGV